MSDVKTAPAPLKKAPAKFYKVTFEDSENIPPGGQFFQLNGRSWMLKAGSTYVIPLGLKEVLDNAIEGAPIINNDTKQIDGYRQRPRFPYRLLGQSDDPDDLLDDA